MHMHPAATVAERRLSIVVLAAGKGRRFNAEGGVGPKLDASVGAQGQTVLGCVLQAVRQSGLDYCVVRPVNSSDGMADSIARGVAQRASAEGWLILPGDLPLIEAGDILRVADHLHEGSVVRPHYNGRHGHPVGFGRAWRDHLLALVGERGAAEVVRLAHSRNAVIDVACEGPGIYSDVDTPSDLARIRNLLER